MIFINKDIYGNTTIRLNSTDFNNTNNFNIKKIIDMKQKFSITALQYFSYLSDEQIDSLFETFRGKEPGQTFEHSICKHIISNTITKKYF